MFRHTDVPCLCYPHCLDTLRSSVTALQQETPTDRLETVVDAMLATACDYNSSPQERLIARLAILGWMSVNDSRRGMELRQSQLDAKEN